MDMKHRRDMQIAYIADQSVMEEMAKCRKILQKLNFADRPLFDGISETVKELLGKSENAWINPPFYCDYGSHIEVGKNFYANYNCTILDVAKVKIGDNCQMAPNVAIYTAGIRSIRIPAIPGSNTGKKLPSGTMSGWAEIPSCVQASTSEITL